MRLRPSGDAGPDRLEPRRLRAATSDELAWTWEHMALTRARADRRRRRRCGERVEASDRATC